MLLFFRTAVCFFRVRYTPETRRKIVFLLSKKKVQKRKENDKKNNKQKFKENVKIFSTPLSASLK